MTELEDVTLGSERENLKPYHWSSPVDLSLSLLFDGQPRADINHQYFSTDLASLCAKLGRYPSGTKLTTFGERSHLAPMLQEINDAATEHGLFIESGR